MTVTDSEAPADGYDIFSPEFRADPYSEWSTIRTQACPVARSEAWGGSWMPVRYDDIHDLGRDAVRLTARASEVSGPLEHAGGLFLPPLTSDPPDHKPHRDLLMPFFVPSRMAALEPFVRRRARELAEGLAASGGGDAVAGFAQELTLGVLAEMMGVSPGDEITGMVLRLIRIGGTNQGVRARAAVEILHYLEALFREREGRPGDDVISYLGSALMDGAPLPERHKLGAAFLMLIAGADTTWSSIGASLWHLGTHPADRRRLVAERSLVESAAEEFLRAYAPVTMGRLVTRNIELHGRCIPAADRLLLAFGAANRDPEVFPDPDVVKIDRARNRHIAFGSGPHRCLGAPLARMELRVALDEWLEAVPEFSLADPDGVEWSGGQVRGPVRLDVQIP